jgi:AcrR family transcriptional regulator
MSPRPQIDHIRRPQLLEAAADVIAERGFTATRIADVAERAGTSPAAVLYWFRSRDELLAEALTYAEESFHERFARTLAELPRPRDRLLALIDASVGPGADWVLWIELWARALRDADLRGARQRLDDRWRTLIATIVADGVHTGDFDDVDPERVAIELASMIDGLAVQIALGDGLVTPGEMRTVCLEVAERLLGVELGAVEQPVG